MKRLCVVLVVAAAVEAAWTNPVEPIAGPFTWHTCWSAERRDFFVSRSTAPLIFVPLHRPGCERGRRLD